MKTIAQKRNILLTRRHEIMVDLEKYQIQLNSRNRTQRKYARKVLEALYLELYYVNRDLQRLARRAFRKASFQLIFAH